MKNPLGMSVIVCCYNSALRLPETVRHLAMQRVPNHIPWEIYVIDNASSDNTARVAAEEWEKYNLTDIGFQVVYEPVPGLINARKKGIDRARYEYLLFCDDDNWLNPDYIVTAFDIMNANPGAGVLGGCGDPVAEQPVNMDERLLSQLNANGPQTWAATDHWVYGAGAVIRKSAFMDLAGQGWQQITAGRTGSSLLSADDVEICFMLYLYGYSIIADQRLTFKHFIPLKRQSTTTILDMAFWLSYSYYLMYSYLIIINNEPGSLQKLSTRLLKIHSISMLRSAYVIMAHRLKTGKSASLEQKCNFLRHYGMASSILKNRKKVIQHSRHIREILKTSPQALLYER